MVNYASLAVLLASTASVALAGVTQGDFSGSANIYVLKTDNINAATPDSYVGCLNNDGRFINPSDKSKCGVFTKTALATLTTSSGNCTFRDTTQEKNTDSKYGQSDDAFHCTDFAVDVSDGFYIIDGFNYAFLCNGDIDCYYDAKKSPSASDNISLWQFHWGAEQFGITPGHTQMALLWNKK